MDPVMINIHEEPDLEQPILIEGLPGVGNVGKLAAEHLIDSIGATKFADIYSRYFPPQVIVDDDGVIRLINNELYYYHSDTEEKRDLIILVGDTQGMSSEGQYEFSYRVLDLAKKYGVTQIFTLGGYGLGRFVEHPRVLGAASSEALVEEMKEIGVTFEKGEPGSGIVGASGLLLGLGKLYGIDGVCLMGETSGYFADPKSAEAVLRILSNVMNVTVDYEELQNKALQIEKITSKLVDHETQQPEAKPEDLRYIG